MNAHMFLLFTNMSPPKHRCSTFKRFPHESTLSTMHYREGALESLLSAMHYKESAHESLLSAIYYRESALGADNTAGQNISRSQVVVPVSATCSRSWLPSSLCILLHVCKNNTPWSPASTPLLQNNGVETGEVAQKWKFQVLPAVASHTN